jgi:hypothetical protein
MGASCSSESTARETELRSAGLVTNHAYSLLGLFEGPGSSPRLVCLRNPWGSGDDATDSATTASIGEVAFSSNWNGAWRDSDPQWNTTPALRNACKPGRQKSAGIFWMSLEDFARCFSRVDVGKLYKTLVLLYASKCRYRRGRTLPGPGSMSCASR